MFSPLEPEQSEQQVPVWLEQPASIGIVPPAIQTAPQVLPLQGLKWEDFERLCLRLIRLEATVESCSLYGTRGQNQSGIDFYARKPGEPLAEVYQCKRVVDLSPALVRTSVKKFKDGKWYKKAAAFFMMTSACASDKAVQDELEAQRAELARDKKRCDILDCEQISLLLKDQPRLVFDFFGRDWAKLFCGDLASETNRLDANEVAEFRRKLGSFYGTVFGRLDPGIPIPPKPGIDPFPLVARFEPLDVIIAEAPHPSVVRIPAEATHEASEDQGSNRTSSDRTASERHTTYTVRRRLADWLSTGYRALIVGGPGTGKSTLLRFVAMELLSPEPSMPDLVAHWGDRLPVWIPFGHWTQLIAQGTTARSLTACLKSWFGAYDRADLYPIVEQATEDERLLLLVDGLDEWGSEQAGRDACHLLQVFIEDRHLAAIVTSRPYGVERLPAFSGRAWQQARLAPLDDLQKLGLAIKWCRLRNRDSGVSEEQDALAQANQFSAHLNASTELTQLSGEPLMLSLLLFIWFKGIALPRSRFEAYNEILKYFLEHHPAARRQGTFVHGDVSSLKSADVRAALACLAFYMQCVTTGSSLSIEEVDRTIQTFLEDETHGLGMSTSSAKRHLHEFSTIAEGDLGALVRHGVNEIGFLHRSFQEYLAAEYLANLSIDEQLRICVEHAHDSRWHEVFLALLWQINRGTDLQSFSVHSVRNAMKHPGVSPCSRLSLRQYTVITVVL